MAVELYKLSETRQLNPKTNNRKQNPQVSEEKPRKKALEQPRGEDNSTDLDSDSETF